MKKWDYFLSQEQKGQYILLEADKCRSARRQRARAFLRQCREETLPLEEKMYAFADEHPELCPPVGSYLYYRSQYGVKIKVTVKVIIHDKPGTQVEILPMSEQPEYLRQPELLAQHTRGLRPSWVRWADMGFYEDWNKLKGTG